MSFMVLSILHPKATYPQLTHLVKFMKTGVKVDLLPKIKLLWFNFKICARKIKLSASAMGNSSMFHKFNHCSHKSVYISHIQLPLAAELFWEDTDGLLCVRNTPGAIGWDPRFTWATPNVLTPAVYSWSARLGPKDSSFVASGELLS